MNKNQFSTEIIIPALEDLESVLPGCSSSEAVSIILGTAATESDFTDKVRQLDSGPALGWYQMEPSTHYSLWIDYILYRDSLTDFMTSIVPFFPHSVPDPMQLVHDSRYSTIMCRLKYWGAPGALPAANDIEGQASYYKKFYNSAKGKGSVEKYIKDYSRYVLT